MVVVEDPTEPQSAQGDVAVNRPVDVATAGEFRAQGLQSARVVLLGWRGVADLTSVGLGWEFHVRAPCQDPRRYLIPRTRE